MHPPFPIHVQDKFQQIYKTSPPEEFIYTLFIPGQIEKRPHEAGALTFSGLKVNK